MEHEHPLVFGDGDTAAALKREERPAMERQAAAVQKILKALAPLPPEGRARVIRAVAALYGIGIP